jgi:hypothetical protein
LNIAKVGIDRDHWHRYFLNGDGPYPGVTSVTGVLDKPALTNWHRETVAGAAWDSLDILEAMRRDDPGNREAAIAYLTKRRDESAKARDRGTDIHALTETLDMGHRIRIPKEHRAEVKSYLAWRETRRPDWLLIEKLVFNTRLKYGGTLDRVALIDGETWLLDIKTSGSVADKNGRVWDEMRLQLLAYAACDITGEPGNPEFGVMPVIDRYGIIHVTPESTALVEAHIDDGDRHAFVSCLDLWRWKKGVAS